MAEIKLKRGETALVDDPDISLISGYSWRAQYSKRGRSIYAVTSIGKRVVSMHRLILNLLGNQQTDHINGNGLDNRRSNLRICNHADNMKNRKIAKNNRSGLKGIWYSAKHRGWRAQIRSNGVRYHLGCFSNAEDAHEAYWQAAKKLHGEFANKGL